MDIEAIENTYPFVKVTSIGKSVLDKDLTILKIGNGSKEVFYSAAIHANEWITCPILMKFAMEYGYAVANSLNIYGYSAEELFNNITLYLAPMLNPDGVDLVTGVISSDRILNDAKKIAELYPSIPFPSGWKANINGVDLNLQFPARMERSKRNKI